jgi:hypothetical protein
MGWENQRPFYKKRLELRKTAPKPPFKAYIYCTKGKKENDKFWIAHRGNNYLANGKVIAEFTCNYVMNHCEMSNVDMAERMSCVPRTEILKYANGKNVLGWHIDNLVIYDEPKELGKFEFPKDNIYQSYRKRNHYFKGITRPPQSWCYVQKGGEQ